MHEQGRPIAVPMHDAPPTKRPLLRLDYCLGVGHPCTGLAVCWYGGAHATHAGPGRPDPPGRTRCGRPRLDQHDGQEDELRGHTPSLLLYSPRPARPARVTATGAPSKLASLSAPGATTPAAPRTAGHPAEGRCPYRHVPGLALLTALLTLPRGRRKDASVAGPTTQLGLDDSEARPSITCVSVAQYASCRRLPSSLPLQVRDGSRDGRSRDGRPRRDRSILGPLPSSALVMGVAAVMLLAGRGASWAWVRSAMLLLRKRMGAPRVKSCAPTCWYSLRSGIGFIVSSEGARPYWHAGR